MTTDEALQLSDEWTRGHTFYEGQGGWRVAISALAAELRAAREHIDRLTEGNSEQLKHAEVVMQRATAERCEQIARGLNNKRGNHPTAEDVRVAIIKEFGLSPDKV